MKFYFSHKQLPFYKNIPQNKRKQVIISLYLQAFKTVWPYIGAFLLFAILMIGKYFFHLHGFWERGVIAILASLTYLQLHYIGIEHIIKKQPELFNIKDKL